jgi:hypothetical protein
VQVYDIFCDIILCIIIFIGSRYIFRSCIKIFCFFSITLGFFFKIVNYVIYPNNILFNRKNTLSKIPTKYNFIQYNHFLAKVSVFY